MTPITIDRLEGDVAVLEIGDTHVHFPVAALPEGAVEGTRLTLSVEAEGTKDALDAAKARLERLKQRDPGGDTFDL